MSNEKALEAAKIETKDTAKATSSEATKSPAGLSDAELDQVSGGLNPQPLPPRAAIDSY